MILWAVSDLDLDLERYQDITNSFKYYSTFFSHYLKLCLLCSPGQPRTRYPSASLSFLSVEIIDVHYHICVPAYLCARAQAYSCVWVQARTYHGIGMWVQGRPRVSVLISHLVLIQGLSVVCHRINQPNWSLSFGILLSPPAHPGSPNRITVIIEVCSHVFLDEGSGDSNSGLHTCMLSYLTKLSLQAWARKH